MTFARSRTPPGSRSTTSSSPCARTRCAVISRRTVASPGSHSLPRCRSRSAPTTKAKRRATDSARCWSSSARRSKNPWQGAGDRREQSRRQDPASRSGARNLLAARGRHALPVPRAIGALESRFNLFGRIPPACNLIVSNFPGPPFPLYCTGARMVAAYPMGPLGIGTALNITVQSYVDTLWFGIVACPDVVPAPETLAVGIHDAVHELGKERALRRG